MSASVSHNLTYVPQNQITSTVRREQVFNYDAKGQFSHWEVSHFIEELNVDGCRLRKDYSQGMLLDRQVQKPPPVFKYSSVQTPAPAFSLPRPSALQTARALSVLLPPVLTPLILTLPFVIYRADGSDNPAGRIIDRVVQLLTIPGNTNEETGSEPGKQKTPDKLPGAEDIRSQLINSKLVTLLAEVVINPGQELQPEIQKALLDLLHTENRSRQVEGEQVSFTLDLSSVDVFSKSAAKENSGARGQETLNPAAIKVSQNSITDINVGREGPAKQVTVKALPGSENATREPGHGERAAKAASGGEAVRPDAGNKVSVNLNTASVMPGQGTSALNQPSHQALASNLPVAMQPPILGETGQKQLPPIILPNVNPGVGNRSERRKSKKELEEEEEKEREGVSWLFDDDEDSFDEP